MNKLLFQDKSYLQSNAYYFLSRPQYILLLTNNCIIVNHFQNIFMMQIKWIERKFNFGYTPEYLPFFIERLLSTVPRIKALVKDLNEEDASVMPDGKWSVKQHIGHLSDLEELHDGRLFDFRERKKQLRAADMGNKKTEEAAHNKKNLHELIHEFESSRKKFIEHVKTFSNEELEVKAFHPRLQAEINIPDLLYFVAEHDLFHQVHISDIISGNRS
jgi:hypothetical protein